jgi:hypothetical protein
MPPHVSTSVETFLGRLASLVPRPRANTTIDAGVLAAQANDRDAVTPTPRQERPRRADASWAALMKRSFGLDAPRAAAAKDAGASWPSVRSRRGTPLLSHLRGFSAPLPIHPARGPPEHEDSLELP